MLTEFTLNLFGLTASEFLVTLGFGIIGGLVIGNLCDRIFIRRH